MGLRGPQAADFGALKLYAAQWAYLLFGLRDGHRDLVEQLEWQQWKQEDGIRFREGAAERIVFARIISTQGQGITDSVGLTHENLIAYQMWNGSNPIEPQPLRHRQRNKMLPKSFSFGSSGVLLFPSMSPRPDLWQQLKHPRSIKGVKQTVDNLYRWMCDAGEVFNGYRIPEERIAELYRATRLWNYPGAKEVERESSENKRIAFFAKSLAGLMLGISPATATKKLCRWKIPQLWKG